ncbi:MAG TPA: hypothetical protein DIT01_12390 [Lentisphaeria bacterium]|jgi:CRP/FNR family cyclic AMP-dependent transcriptional regulator|nr:hypothetical protein [Lentisphaeria bacterium]|tara:strand:+ start:254 stop:724 length:471 start_codon:yes stop_codon:yes gene_type:complete
MNEFSFDVTGLKEQTFEKGEHVLEEGKDSQNVFILKDGNVSVTADGTELCKANTPGTIFGEISVLIDSNHTATVTAEDQTTFYVVDDLMAYFESNPTACLKVAQTLATRVMNMNTHFLEIKHEILQLQEDASSNQGGSKLLTLVEKMDQFWGQDIL